MQLDPQEQSLRDSFVNLCRYAIGIIEDQIAASGLETSKRPVIEFFESGHGIGYVDWADYYSLLEPHLKTVRESPVGARFLNEHQTIGVTTSGFSSSCPSDQYLVHDAISILMWAIQDHHRLHLSDAELEVAYADFRYTHPSPGPYREAQCTLLMPIRRVVTCCDPSELEAALGITVFTPDEKTGIHHQPFGYASIAPGDLVECDLKIEESFLKAYGQAVPPPIEQLTSTILALRLLKPGDIGSPGVIQNCRASGQGGASSPPELDSRKERAYYLTEADLLPAQHLLAMVRSHHIDDLLVAFSRFNLAYSRTSLEDQIVDCAVAFESSLLWHTRDELKYRLALRAAALLSETLDPEHVIRVMNALYDARSAIVHDGGRFASVGTKQGALQKIVKKVASNPAEFVQQCSDLLRSVLRECTLRLGAGQKLADVTEELDLAIVNGVRRDRVPSDVLLRLVGFAARLGADEVSRASDADLVKAFWSECHQSTAPQCLQYQRSGVMDGAGNLTPKGKRLIRRFAQSLATAS